MTTDPVIPTPTEGGSVPPPIGSVVVVVDELGLETVALVLARNGDGSIRALKVVPVDAFCQVYGEPVVLDASPWESSAASRWRRLRLTTS